MHAQSDSPAAAQFAPLAEKFAAIRAHSVALAAPLSDEDCAAQSMPDASPAKWHLAHSSWFFETFILERFEPNFAPFHQAFRILFNSYYNGVGEKHPRPERGFLTRPSRREVMAYRRDIDARIIKLLNTKLATSEIVSLIELGLQHEQQHQELLLTDILHLLSRNPLFPAYDEAFFITPESPSREWRGIEPGLIEIGHAGAGFCFDNELPRHRHFVEAYELASNLVTNAEYAGFIAAGGYEDPLFWLSEGWSWLQKNNIHHPLYWHKTESGWQEFSLAGLQPLNMRAPLRHISYFEASAFAQFAGARLPTEEEWEYAAQLPGFAQMFGTAWQWTSSSYAPYPGFAAAAGAIGEYNGKFMVNQYVLRGSSSITPAHHSRPSYRNFFSANSRWQCTGIRLAR